MAHVMAQGKHSSAHFKRRRRMELLRKVMLFRPKFPTVRRTKSLHHREQSLVRPVVLASAFLAGSIAVFLLPLPYAVQRLLISGAVIAFGIRLVVRLIRHPGQRHFNGAEPTQEERETGPMRIVPTEPQLDDTPIDGIPVAMPQPQSRNLLQGRHKVLAWMMTLMIALDLIEYHNKGVLERNREWAARDDARMGINSSGSEYGDST